MNKILAVMLIMGFALVDFLFFHDILKPGERTTPAQYITGLLSLVVFFVSARALVSLRNNHN